MCTWHYLLHPCCNLVNQRKWIYCDIFRHDKRECVVLQTPTQTCKQFCFRCLEQTWKEAEETETYQREVREIRGEGRFELPESGR